MVEEGTPTGRKDRNQVWGTYRYVVGRHTGRRQCEGHVGMCSEENGMWHLHTCPFH
jgi:hypothetical protein